MTGVHINSEYWETDNYAQKEDNSKDTVKMSYEDGGRGWNDVVTNQGNLGFDSTWS